jgi:hypothetical protein
VATYNVNYAEVATAADSVTARMISDAQFTDWLKADNKRRCVLVEAGVYSGGDTTRYFSNIGYTSAPGESPANTPYEDILVGIPEIRSSMAEAFRGRSLISYGEVEIDNSGGVRDSWLEDAWDQRDIRIYLGDPTWAKSDFRLVFLGIIEDIRARDGNTLALRIRDRQSVLDVPLQVNTIAAGPQLGERRPVCYGTCYNVEPKVVGTGGEGVYEFHDRALLAIDTVYQDGVSINITCTRTPGGGSGYGANAQPTIGNPLTGRMTAHVRGFETKTGDIVKKILIERGGLSESQIDPAAITAYNAAAGGNATIGFYSTDDAETVGTALDTIMAGIGGYYTIDRDGRFTGGVFDDPTLGNSVLTLTADDIAEGEIELLRRIVPPKSGRIGWRRYWSPLSYVAPSVTNVTTRRRFTVEYEVVATAYTPGAQFRGLDEDMQPSCFANSTDASAEGTRRKTLWGNLRFIFRVRAFLGAQQVKIGDCITVDVPRYGFSGGDKVIVVGMRESLTSGYVDLEVFR